MENLLKNKYLIIVALVIGFNASAQSWKPAMSGINTYQPGLFGDYVFKFKNNIMGRDWMYGGYLDEDSLRRCVAYREAGKWVPLPFSGYEFNKAYDMIMYGDTLYITGSFSDIVLDKDSSILPNTSLLKWYNDSLWTTFPHPGGIKSMSVKGDSLAAWGDGYLTSTDTIFGHFITTNGIDWSYPYSIVHPTDSLPDFGAHAKVKILDNGDILTINNASPRANPFSGLSRWNGQQWHSYGNGLFGWTSRTFDFEFYQGELFMGGTFTRNDFPDDPAKSVGRWDGFQWHELSTGIHNAFVSDLFVHDSILYAFADGGDENFHQFGDVLIPYFAGWDGHQWCGTPSTFSPPPTSFGFVNDTLYATFNWHGNINGDSISYVNYYDGDYLHGPNSICSTFGIGQNEISKEDSFISIFPNPANDQLNIIFPNQTRTNKCTIQIMEPSGSCIKSYKVSPQIQELNLDLSDIPSGLYFLKIGENHNFKFIKN